MKDRFTTLDVVAAVQDLQTVIGMRVYNIYDINSKTYLIRLKEKDKKAVIMFESGIRIHLTEREWPKNQIPSSFSMKLRKHVKNSRLETVKQFSVGNDRVVDLQFTDKDGSVHVILELYDRGNILLTDAQYTILNILRPRTDKDNDVKLSVKENYPIELARKDQTIPTLENLKALLLTAKKGEILKRLLVPHVVFGGPLVDHILLLHGFPTKTLIGANVEVNDETILKIFQALQIGEKIFEEIRSSAPTGLLTYKKEQRADGKFVETFEDYHPYPFQQALLLPHSTYPSFSAAVDEFYAKQETQKLEQRALNIEKAAIKKLNNVKKDQEARILALDEAKRQQEIMGERIVLNEKLIERALMAMRTMIASRSDWSAIEQLWKQAVQAGDETASRIVKLELEQNQFVMRLGDPFNEDEKPINVKIDIALNAHQNSRKYFVDKKAADVKKEKTIQAQTKAVKNAQAKAKDTIDLVRIKTDVVKSRKQFWFEKFVWFISSEDYIVIAGRDAQQNELVVKRYLRPGDVYVHADLRGAASVVIRNKVASNEIPPKTLIEAAQLAICYSGAWDSKVITNAWWVHHDQVSRTAPTGEYLPSGSFMIRGKKNFLPPSQLVLGFALLFRLDEDSIKRHEGERKQLNNDGEEINNKEGEDQELDIADEDGEDEEGNDEEMQFPDVNVPISTLKLQENEEEYTILEIGTKAGKPAQLVRPETRKYLEDKNQIEDVTTKLKREQAASARQKKKQKLIKKKYADQDEEEREQRMQILGSRGQPKNVSEKKEKEPLIESKLRKEEKRGDNLRKNPSQEGEDEVIDEAVVMVDDVVEENVLQSLTGRPVDEDTLLFALPVVAPYNTLISYKYKVKLTPGTGKRGRAVKSALELFMRFATSTPRELALIKALVGDDSAFRNVPGKIKVSAPQLHTK